MAGRCCKALVPSPCPSGCAAETALSKPPKGLAWVSSQTRLCCRVGTGGCRREAGGDLLVSSPAVLLSKEGAHIWADRPNRLLLTVPVSSAT